MGGACGDDVENWTYRNFFFLLLGTWFGFGAWGVARGSWFLGRVVGFASWSAACAAWQAVGVRGLVLDREVKPEKKIVQNDQKILLLRHRDTNHGHYYHTNAVTLEAQQVVYV